MSINLNLVAWENDLSKKESVVCEARGGFKRLSAAFQ